MRLNKFFDIYVNVSFQKFPEFFLILLVLPARNLIVKKYNSFKKGFKNFNLRSTQKKTFIITSLYF